MPLAEHDALPNGHSDLIFTFQFTCPSRSTTSSSKPSASSLLVSIHVPLAEHDICGVNVGLLYSVSIHVPLAEHDAGESQDRFFLSVSIHVPLAEHDG